MKSRLKEIKDNHEFGKGEGWEITILSEDIDWLIEQAEKVEVQQKEIEGLKIVIEIERSFIQNSESLLINKNKEQQKEIELLNKALEIYVDEDIQ
jgi:hypothetical protein